MIPKIRVLPHLDEHHEPTVRTLWHPTMSDIVKVGSSALAGVHPEVRSWIEAHVKPTDGKTFKLICAQGSYEYWGQNRNGDRFRERCPWDPFRKWGVRLDDPDYGYRSFLNAGVFHHHCFPAGTEVTLADRRRVPIETVQGGYLVATLEGAKAVTSVMRRSYRGPGVRLTLKGKRSDLVGTEDHPVLVLHRGQVHCRHNYSKLNQTDHILSHCKEAKDPVGDPKWLPLKEVQPGDYLLLPKPEHGSQKVDPEFAELVGWVASEGYLGARGIIQFTFAENSPDVQSVTDCLAANGVHVCRTPRLQFGTVMLSACSQDLHRRLSEFVVGVLSEKRLTAAVLSWDRESLLRMLGAYIDGDGSVSPSGTTRGQLRIRSSSTGMLDALGDIVQALGYPCAVNMDRPAGDMVSPTNGKIYATSESGCVSVQAAFVPDVARYSRKVLDRGSTRMPEVDQYRDMYLVRVLDSERVELDEDVFNLSVEGPEHYLAGDVIVHNCNKDKGKTTGEVPFSFFHPQMHRVELVLAFDHAKLKEQGFEDYLGLLNPDYSMACKVPWDRCFPAGTLVRTSTGHKPIEDIRTGDLVRTHTGRLSPVTELMQHVTEGGTISVVANGIPPLSPTPNHPMLILRGGLVRPCVGHSNGHPTRHQPGGGNCRRCGKDLTGWAPEWVVAGDLQAGDYLLAPVDPCRLESVDVPKARLLGYYLGDGFIIRQRTGKKKDGSYRDMGVSFSVGGEERAHLDQLLHTLFAVGAANKPRLYEASNDKKALVVNVFDQGLAADLLSLGGQYSDKKRIREDVFSWSEIEKLSLVGAYIDTDGHCDAWGRVRVCTINRGLALDLQRLLLSLRIPASVGIGRRGAEHWGSKKDVYRVFIPGASVDRLAPYSVKIRGSSWSPRKAWPASRGFFWKSWWCTPVRSVVSNSGPVEVFNFSVADDESYIAEGVAVHNCSSCCDIEKFKRAVATAKSTKPIDVVMAVLAFHKKDPIRGLAITRKEYCDCLKHRMNQLTNVPENGTVIGMENDFPKYFDISRVTVGAAVEAKEMLKVAGVGTPDAIPSYLLAEMWGIPERLVVEEDLEKVAKVTSAAIAHKAEIDKRIAAENIVPALAVEKDLPNEVLDRAGDDDVAPSHLLSSMGSLGIVASPREFQRIVLVSVGKKGLADDLDRRGQVFAPSSEELPFDMGPGSFVPGLVRSLLPFLENRSCLAPVGVRRVMQVTITISPKPETEKKAALAVPKDEEEAFILQKLGGLYRGYRENLPAVILDLVKKACEMPEAVSAVWTDEFMRLSPMSKTAAAPKEILALAAGILPLLYMYSAKLRDEEQKGQNLGMIEGAVANHPVLSSSAIIALLKALLLKRQ